MRSIPTIPNMVGNATKSHAKPRSPRLLIRVWVALGALALVALSVVVINARQSPCDEWRQRFHDALISAHTATSHEGRTLPTLVEAERPEGC